MTAPISQGGERRVRQSEPHVLSGGFRDRYERSDGLSHCDERTIQRRVALSKRTILDFAIAARWDKTRLAALHEIVLSIRSRPHDAPACPDCEGKGCVECDGPEHRNASPQPREGVCVCRGKLNVGDAKGAEVNDDNRFGVADLWCEVPNSLDHLDNHRVSVWIVEEGKTR